jgi:large subunit ribosomal protein L18
MPTKKQQLRNRRKVRIRAKVQGTAVRPRLVVFKSLIHIYAQVVNDENGTVLASSSDLKAKGKGTKTEKAKKVGEEIAKLAKEKKLEAVVFDRNGFKYHGRIKALADAARDGGLKF